MKRRQFLTAAAAPSLLASLPEAVFSKTRPDKKDQAWDQGRVQHILPTVSHESFLIKVSLLNALQSAPVLWVNGLKVPGTMTDTQGSYWKFHVKGLQAQTSYSLSLKSTSNRLLCEPWTLKTFPSPDSLPAKVRLLFFTCSGGHEELTFLPTSVRQKLLNRGLSFKPDAAIANGDQVYWDLRSPLTAKGSGASPKAKELIGGEFDRSMVALGSNNEMLLKRAVTHRSPPCMEQISDLRLFSLSKMIMIILTTTTPMTRSSPFRPTSL